MGVGCYRLPLRLQEEWLGLRGAREWVAGLRLSGDVLEWFGLRFGAEGSVEFISLEGVAGAVGTVHYHPYEHSLLPIPSMSDGLAWVYLSYHEIPDDLNPIFFIVFRDGYAGWVMFPKPPVVRRVWREEYLRVREEDTASWRLCLRLLDEGMMKAGVLRLGQSEAEFQTF